MLIRRRGMAARLVLISVLGFSLLLSACQRASQQADQAPEVQVSLAVQPDPPQVGPARLVVTLADGAGKPIEDARLRIKGDMSHAGMVPVRADVDTGGPGGVYETAFEWTMGGDWIVTVTAVLADGRVTSREFRYSLP